MTDKIADKTIAQQTELALRQLDSLEISPSVAAVCFSKLIEPQFAPASLAEVIESEPVLAAKIFSLLYRHGINTAEEKLSLRQAIDRVSAQAIRDAIFAIKVSAASEKGEVSRTDLIRHSLATACCAGKIAAAVKMDTGMCYCAGLLHDIGKIALQQLIPKSFAIITEEAKQQQQSICQAEQKHLGIDHTVFGKRLAQKWHLPVDVELAIWLHHSDTAAISVNIPEAKIAKVVQLADLTARLCGIGKSGSYDAADSSGQLAESLGITENQLEQIREELPELVNKRSEAIGPGVLSPQEAYLKALHNTAVKLTAKESQLSEENLRLQTASSHLNFITEFLSSVSSADSPIDIAESFAARWQRFYQTGKVCLYLAPPQGSCLIEAVLVEGLSQSRVVTLQLPDELPAIPHELVKNFGVLNAYQHIDWLFEQFDVDFESQQTKLMPLSSGGRAVGAIAFELRYPSDVELFVENFKMVTSVAGLVLDLAMRGHNQEQFAERFLQLLGQPKENHPPVAEPKQQAEHTYSLQTLAEMAGGAAHELNNPLAVISGRAQLLAQSETDSDRKRMLKQIRDNAAEITRIVEDLMAFANPHEPQPTQTDVRQMLDEAIQLAAMKEKVDKLNVQIDIDDSAGEIYVDSAQAASAVANVLCNSVESYADSAGLIKISVQANNGNVRLAITDSGVGMDSETLRKATQPFFSNRPAGRSRGMGLAHTNRLVELNKGTLQITSEPGSGTTVTILLPAKTGI